MSGYGRCRATLKTQQGNIALHIAGNLKTFTGAVLGGTGYVRQRDKELSETSAQSN
jgi:hypothetical protein